MASTCGRSLGVWKSKRLLLRPHWKTLNWNESTLHSIASFTFNCDLDLVKAMLDYVSVENVACLAPKVGGTNLALRVVPNCTRKGFYLSPWQMSLSEDAKFGKWPSNFQVKQHFTSILTHGFQSEREPLDVRFDTGDAVRDITPFSVRYVDGHTRGLMSQLVFALMIHCETRLSFWSIAKLNL